MVNRDMKKNELPGAVLTGRAPESPISEGPLAMRLVVVCLQVAAQQVLQR